nr:hypothetical protein [Tanacetum cinerariifolium]
MGQGSAHGSAPVDDDDEDDDDDSSVKEMLPVKKPSKRASRAKKNDANDNEKGNSMKVKGFWEAIIKYFKKETDEYEEAREHRPLGRDAAKAKKKSSASSRLHLLIW